MLAWFVTPSVKALWTSLDENPDPIMEFLENTAHRVLLVDDNEFILGVFANLLGELCPVAHLTTAKTVQEATEVLEADVFGLIFLDDCLPDGSGHELLQILMSPRHAGALVVGFTGSRTTPNKSVPFLERMNGHVSKTEAKDNLTIWLSRAGFPGRQEPTPTSLSAQTELKRVAQEELRIGLETLGRLITNTDQAAIAAQAHRLIGLTGVTQQHDLRQIFESIQESASTNDMAASRQTWDYLQIVLKQQSQLPC